MSGARGFPLSPRVWIFQTGTNHFGHDTINYECVAKGTFLVPRTPLRVNSDSVALLSTSDAMRYLELRTETFCYARDQGEVRAVIGAKCRGGGWRGSRENRCRGRPPPVRPSCTRKTVVALGGVHSHAIMPTSSCTSRTVVGEAIIGSTWRLIAAVHVRTCTNSRPRYRRLVCSTTSAGPAARENTRLIRERTCRDVQAVWVCVTPAPSNLSRVCPSITPCDKSRTHQ